MQTDLTHKDNKTSLKAKNNFCLQDWFDDGYTNAFGENKREDETFLFRDFEYYRCNFVKIIVLFQSIYIHTKLLIIEH